MAQSIIDERTKNGAFASVDDLMRVSGIGEKKLAKIKELHLRMSATEREHVMPPRPSMPWTMALCAGMCVSCALVLNVAADALLRERVPAVGPLWAIPIAAAVFVVLAQSCARLAL